MDVKLPKLGEGADSGTVVNLFVKEGDRISRDQPIIELENEKAVATIPSTADGVVSKIFVKAGDKLSVGQRILSLSGGRPTETSPPSAAGEAATATSERRSPPAAVAPTPEAPGTLDLSATNPNAWAAPSIRKMARDLGLDLTRVRGSARGGRIVLEDLRAHIQRLQRIALESRPVPGQPAATPKPEAESLDFSKWGPTTRKPLSALRQVIARRMSESWHAVPRVTQFDEADVTDLNGLRKKHAAAYEQKGVRLTMTSFVLKVLVDTLKQHAAFNASLDEAAREIVLKQYFHIGIAVDTDAGLIVPVLRDADRKSLLQLSRELEELAVKARERKVSADELKGGTFTISNQGGVGGAHFTPVVNLPEVAILGLGRAAMRPVVREGRIEPRLMLPLALSYDHRVIDGAAAARFIVDLVRAFEHFDESLVLIAS
jgi:pyruvate dehydrogenase E2 component (dihydrolipoamide acetyltransferase)